MASQNGIFAHKSKQINAIQLQLASEFHPAVKNVASAGQNLLKAYQNLSRHHYVYTASLYALAFSGSTAEPEVQEKSRQLEQIIAALKAIHGEETKWVEYFTKMTTTINRNCESEKERLKALQGGFGKRERDLARAVDRGKKNPTELDKFYAKELAEMRDQQAQRYRFFVEKHLELLKHYMEWTRWSTALLEKELEEEEEEGERKEGEYLDELANRVGKMAENDREQEEEEEKGRKKMANGKKKKKMVMMAELAPNGQQQQQQSSRRGSSQIQVQLDGRRLSLLSDQQGTTTMAAAGGQIHPIGQQPQGIFRPIPILPENQQKFRHSLALTDAVGRANGELSPWERQQMASLPAEHHRRQQQQVIQQLEQFYREGPPAGGTHQVDRIGQQENRGGQAVAEQLLQHNRVPIGQYRHFGPPNSLPHKPISPLVTGNGGAQNNSFSHGRGHSQESTASSGMAMARSTPPIFCAADYGRHVECITPYEGQGENQLSLGIGERIMLVKNGTRGWVLARSVQGDRQGWFPAKYLKLT